MTCYVKIKGEWHIVECEECHPMTGCKGNKLMCNGVVVIKGMKECEDIIPDSDPVCEMCLHPLPDKIKERLRNK